MAHRSRDLPWSFLNNTKAAASAPTKTITTETSPQRKSFAQALNNACHVPIQNFPKPCLKGDRLSIKIPEESYQAGLERCKNNLHGRLIMAKGDKPLRLNELREKLIQAWAPVEQWQITPLGKGFYEFYFQSREDLNRIWSIGTWNLKPGLLRLSAWTSDFKPEELKITHAQVWVRMYGLPQEYWMPTTLFAIASGLGTPLSLDTATQQRTFGHFARVLVDINLAEELHYRILVEREGYAFFADVDYENLPYFCEHCCCVGHSITQCRKVHRTAQVQKQPVEKVVKKSTTMFVPKEKNITPVQEQPNNESDHVSLHSESDQDDDLVVQDTFVDAIDSPVAHEQPVTVIVPVAAENPRQEDGNNILVTQERVGSPSWADEAENTDDAEGEFTVVKARKGRGKNKIYTPKPDLQTRSRTGKLHHTQ
jgi:hypothetical protein